MTPLERAARALHAEYLSERKRFGVKPSDLPTWEKLGEDGIYSFTSTVRTVLAAMREPTDEMLKAGKCTVEHWHRMVDIASRS